MMMSSFSKTLSAAPSLAAAKTPGSAVAGRATVFIFRDLNTGNATRSEGSD
jgi:phosphotransacetylase